MYVNVSTSPINDPLYRFFPRIPSNYEGQNLVLMGKAQVRVRAWKQSSLPVEDFKQSGIMLKANTSKVSDSYAEVDHSLGEMPCLVVVRMQMQHGSGTIMADGVGSCMQVFAGVPDRTNAYLVYGYSNTAFRLWVDSSIYGAIFDGRKHTWFDMVKSEGEAEIFAWKCSTITPLYNNRVVTKHTMDRVPEWWNIDVDYDLETSLIRVSVLAEEPDGANQGFRFPGAMHLGYPALSEIGNSVKHTAVGGLSYTYELNDKFNFWQPKFDNKSTIFIAESFGQGTNSELSNSESIYVQSFIYEENGGCPTPVIPNGFANTYVNGTSLGAQAKVHCNKGFVMKPKKKYYSHDNESNTITCQKFGYWDNFPSCLPKDKEVGIECNPAVDKCRDQHAACVIIRNSDAYKCTCNDGYRHKDGHCKAQGQYIPKADYDSDWVGISRGRDLELEHGLGIVPLLVDVQVHVSGYTFHAIGFPPDEDENSWNTGAVVYIYDENYINVSSFKHFGIWSSDGKLIQRSSYMWYGYEYSWSHYGTVRARAWKSESLPSPDLFDDSKVLRANGSSVRDSFYELEHNLREYPGLVVVRAKMMHNGSTFYADGVGSALNVFYNNPDKANAFLVYGFSNESVRMWVDSSVNGAIFDGRKRTKFDIVVSEAAVEIYAWKLSTMTPFYTYMFSLEDDRFPYSDKLLMNYELSDAVNVAVVQITDPSSRNQDYRFPSSTYLSDRDGYREGANDSRCIFGGFTYGYEKGLGIYWYTSETDVNMLMYKPKNYTSPYYDTGALVCIPDSFGNGKYSEAAFNGIGIMYSWINGDCGPPVIENGFLNTTVNGTEAGAIVAVGCYEGYRLSGDKEAVCQADLEWLFFSSCNPVECETLEAPANGTMNVSGLTFGNNVTFQCDAGYNLNGSEVIECLSTGNWSSSAPFCSLHVEHVEHVEEEKITSRSVREQVSAVGIWFAISMYIVAFIEQL